jgi:thiosulfate reductase cytochrome b subunit
MLIVTSHPRFYWGEAGNIHTEPLFKLPIPASRSTVSTGYGFRLPDMNGWSRYLHFQAAWVLVFAGAAYLAWGLVTLHFWKNLFPGSGDLSWTAVRSSRPEEVDGRSYNPIQRLTYLVVIFVLFPLVIWTGLAMSPAVVSAIPSTVTILGGQQSARTIHFFVSLILSAFLLVHVTMVWRAGFWKRVRAMITG